MDSISNATNNLILANLAASVELNNNSSNPAQEDSSMEPAVQLSPNHSNKRHQPSSATSSKQRNKKTKTIYGVKAYNDGSKYKG